MKFDAIRVNSAPEVLVEQIIGRLKTGELKPGTRLPSQRELAKNFQVGLGSVREAIKILNVMGYLEVVQGKGTYIAHDALNHAPAGARLDKMLEAVSLADLMKAREVVECGAAELAAETADGATVGQLQEIVGRMEKALTDPERVYEFDFAFHIAVAEATNNMALTEIAKFLVDKAHDYIEFMSQSLSISGPINVEQAYRTAREVVDAIADGDPSAARRAMKAHLNIVNFEIKKEFLSDGSLS
jgi:GntR family transcriptional repressor for pyruvate dehydrogenase complex